MLNLLVNSSFFRKNKSYKGPIKLVIYNPLIAS